MPADKIKKDAYFLAHGIFNK